MIFDDEDDRLAEPVYAAVILDFLKSTGLASITGDGFHYNVVLVLENIFATENAIENSIMTTIKYYIMV